MLELLRAYKANDPAARSKVEIFFLYPGFRAVCLHRLAHFLFRHHIPFIPRFMSEFSRFLNAIDIHPGATLGKNLVIDHGLGLVIGETAVVGDHVILYQGVTLGGTRLGPGKRHPTLEDRVIIGAGAKILGDIRVQSRARVGANSVVIHDVAPDTTVVGVPAQVVHKGSAPVSELYHDYVI